MKYCVSVELTNLCNFSCLICPRSHGALIRKRGFMSEPLYREVVRQCNLYAHTVELGFFGEQLLHPQYASYLSMLAKRNFRLSVNTNLSLCTADTFKLWNAIKLDEVRLSLDAAYSYTFDKCRPGPMHRLDGKLAANRFEAACEKVDYWLSLPAHRPTRLVFVKSSHNEADRDEFVRLWKGKLGSQDHILMKQVVSYGGKVKDPYVLPNKCNIWDLRYIVIGHDGTTSPCNLDINLELSLGNMKNSPLPVLYNNGIHNLRKKTGCGCAISPCNKCSDSNNWSKNEVITK